MDTPMEEISQIAMIEQYLSGGISLKEICYRFRIHRTTVWRKIRRLKEGGREALEHRLRGRPSNNSKTQEIKKLVCELYDRDYRPRGVTIWGFYHQVARTLPEYVSFSSVRRWLKQFLAGGSQ